VIKLILAVVKISEIMPKQPESHLCKMKRYIREFGDVLTIQTDQKTKSQILFCQCCCTKVSFEKRSHVKQHLDSGLHQNKAKNYKSKQISVQSLFTNSQKEFNNDLCEFAIALNIPFDRFLKPGAHKFMKKYTQFKVPEPSTLWRYNLKPLYDQTLDKIRNYLKDQYIWLSIDETTDRLKRIVSNVIVGALNSDNEKNEKFLLNMEFLKNQKSSTIVQTVNNALNILWPEGVKYDKVLLLITDAALNMKSAGQTLCQTYPKLIHITCLAHGLHNICEYLMVLYTNVNRLISCGKRIFKKAPNRTELFKEQYPNIPLPPEPVKTRWGSWLKAVKYYAKYLKEFTEIIELLDVEDSAFIQEARDLVKDLSVKNELSYIYANFDCLDKAITQLETSNLTLNESLGLVQSVYDNLKQSLSESSPVFNKLEKVLNKNKGFKQIKKISEILNGKINVELDIDLSPQEIASFKRSPLTNCDIERSFSKYKFILCDNRLSFEEQNLKYYVITHCNTE